MPNAAVEKRLQVNKSLIRWQLELPLVNVIIVHLHPNNIADSVQNSHHVRPAAADSKREPKPTPSSVNSGVSDAASSCRVSMSAARETKRDLRNSNMT